MLGREVTTEGANRDERQQRETDEDVRAVEAGQAVEDGAERAVVRREADAGVLTDLREEERQPERDRQHQPSLEPCAIAALDRLERPVDREAGGDEDRRVHTGDEPWELERRQRPRLVGSHPHEEVGGEERAEEHDLRRDEEEHAKDWWLDPRAPVRLGRMKCVRVVGFGVGAHDSTGSGCAPTSSAGITTCSTGTPESFWSRWIRSFRIHGDSAGSKVETMISSTRSSSIACIAAVYGSGWATCPCASIPRPRSSASTRRSRRSASGCDPCSGSLCGEMIRKPAGLREARSRIRSRSASPITVSFAITRTLAGPSSSSRSTTTCSTGTSPAAFLTRSTTLRRIQPDFSTGCVDRIT